MIRMLEPKSLVTFWWFRVKAKMRGGRVVSGNVDMRTVFR